MNIPEQYSITSFIKNLGLLVIDSLCKLMCSVLLTRFFACKSEIAFWQQLDGDTN